MDCRITLLLALAVASGCLGCMQTTQTLNPSPGQQPPPTQKPAARAKRAPKAETCVAWAVCREREADLLPDADTKQDAFDQAREAYLQALKADANYLPAYRGLARIQMNMNHYDRAAETYHKALQKHPREAVLWYDLGICHCRTKNWELAIRSFRKALELEPESRPVTQSLGFCLARAGHLQESLDTLEKVMTHAQAHLTVARMLHHMNRDDLCQQYLRQALDCDPALTQAQNLLTRLQGDAREAPAGAEQESDGVGSAPIQIDFEN